jgi:hypothetical protein
MLCPSRGRPQNVAELRELWPKVTAGADLLVAVDEDDPKAGEYGTDVQVMGPPHLGLGPILNELAPRFAHQYDYVGFLGDDHRPRTPGWDQKLVDALGGRPGVAYGDDQHQGKRAATAVVISSDVLIALGYMVPPGVIHMYMDIFWVQMGKDLGNLAYCPDVIIEHCHPHAGKAPWDEGYERVNTIERYSRDELGWLLYQAGMWPSELERIRGILAG